MKNYIIITGGELFNKGAQAMLYSVYQHFSQQYDHLEVVAFSSLDIEHKSQKDLKFNVMFYTLRFKLRKLFPILRPIVKESKKQKDLDLQEILDNAALALDISGFALSSKFPLRANLSYLFNMGILQKYKVPTILMPQSFGPFDYQGKQKAIVGYFLRKYISHPDLIFAREEASMKEIKRYTKSEVKLSPDLVLLSESLEGKNIYKTTRNVDIDISDNAVAIIPNVKLIKFNDWDVILRFYKTIINEITKSGLVVYGIYHSQEDLTMLRKIQAEGNEFEIIEEELDCIAIDEIIKKFQFIVGSRYHSIVHAYKNFVPSLVVGWADKYVELTKIMGQNKFVVDLSSFEESELLEKVQLLIGENANQSSLIKNKLTALKSEVNLFESIPLTSIQA